MKTYLSALILILFVFSSCKEDDDLINFLVKTEIFEINTQCPNGGVAVHSGQDINNNGILEENEIMDVEFVCNLAPDMEEEEEEEEEVPTKPIIVSIEEEAAGGNCANGGKVILVGMDLNENNILDANEVTNQSFICNTPTSTINIVTIGDSLTNPYSDDLQEYLGGNYNVIARGIGGEDVNEVGFRQGGIKLFFEKELVLPGDGSEIEIGDVINSSGMVSEFNGGEIQPILDGGAWMVNPCLIGNISCTLKWTGSSHVDPNGRYTLKRNEVSSEDIVLPVKTYLIPKMSFTYKDEVQIIFMGQNGGYTDSPQLVDAFKSCTDFLDHDKYIVIMSHLNESTDIDTLMRNEFGNKFINLKTQMELHGLEYAGINWPGAFWKNDLLSDGVHFNGFGQAAQAKIVGDRIRELNY